MGTCFSFSAGLAQKDTITYNSTCVNYKIEFGSNLFDSIGFPDKVIWNFGDPSSGFYNSAGNQTPTHLYASTGIYPISLMVILAGDTSLLKDTVHIITPVNYNFGPDIYLCAKGDTTITGTDYSWCRLFME